MARLGTFRRDTAANWTLVNPIIADGEFVLVATDPLQPKLYDQYKVGDGTKTYTQLPFRGLPAVQTTGTSITDVMSQAAVTKEISDLELELDKKIVGITPIILSQGYVINSLYGESSLNAASSACLDYLIYQDVYRENRVMSKTPSWYILYDENKVYLGRSNNLSSVPAGTVFFRFYFNSVIAYVYYSEFQTKEEAATEKATLELKVNMFGVATGTAQAQVLTVSTTIPALAAGMRFTFRPVANNTGAGVTLNVNGKGAKTILAGANVGYSSVLLPSDMLSTVDATVEYDGTVFRLQNPQAQLNVSSTKTGKELAKINANFGVTLTIENGFAWNGTNGNDEAGINYARSSKVYYTSGSKVIGSIPTQILFWDNNKSFLGVSTTNYDAFPNAEMVAFNFSPNPISSTYILSRTPFDNIYDILDIEWIAGGYTFTGGIAASNYRLELFPAKYNDIITSSIESGLYRINMFDANKVNISQGGFLGGSTFTVNELNTEYIGITTTNIANNSISKNGIRISMIPIISINSDNISTLQNTVEGYYPFASHSLITNNVLKQTVAAIRELYIPNFDTTFDYIIQSVRRNQLISGTYYYVVSIRKLIKGTTTEVLTYGFSKVNEISPVVYDEGDGLQLLHLTNGGYCLIDWSKISYGTGYGATSLSYLADNKIGNINNSPIIKQTILQIDPSSYALKSEVDVKANTSDIMLKTVADNTYAVKSITEISLSNHEDRVSSIESDIETINSNTNLINESLSALISTTLTEGTITGNNVWIGANSFLQPISGVSAVLDSEYIRKGEYKQTLNRFVDVKDYGFDPSETSENNTIYLQAALTGGNKTVVISYPGTYLLSSTIYLDDNTELICGKGVILKKDAFYSCVFLNRGALNRSLNSNIILRGVSIDCNNLYSNNYTIGNPLYGTRGQIAFVHASHIGLYDINIINATVFAIQLCTFYDVIIDRFYIQTLGDGLHINRGEKLVAKNGIISSYDDALALNASDWIDSCPEVGDIIDITFENITDVKKETTTGYVSRHLVGAWVDWYNGMIVRHGDKVVNNGHVYRVYGSGATEYVSTTEPVFESTPIGSLTDEGGFTWRYNQDDAVYSANILNVTYRGLSLLESRTMVSCYMETGGIWDRSIYPDVLPANYPYAKGVLIEDVYKPSLGCILDINNQNIKYDYKIRCIKKFNDTAFVNASTTDYGLINIDSCNFNATVNIGLGAIAYINNNNGNPIGGLKNGKVISNNNMAALPAIIKGSRCMYNDEPYYCNGVSWINLSQL